MTREANRRRQREATRGYVAFLIANAGAEDLPYDELLGMADAIMTAFVLRSK